MGKCAPGVALLFRAALRKEATYKNVSDFSGVTTSRGRQQARLLFKRKVDQIMIEN